MSPRVFILTHNPKYSWSLNELPGYVERTAAGKRIHDDWSTGSRRDISPGDVGFLLRQGDRRGIVAKGVFEMPSTATKRRVRQRGVKSNGTFEHVVYEEWHWADFDLPKCERRIARYADLSWTRIVDTADRLPVEELKRRFTTVHWDMMYGSGVEVKGAVGQRLIRAWDEHLALLVGGPYVVDDDDEVVEYVEGRPIRASVTRFERVPANRKACLDHHGFRCAACGFDFEDKYGSRGARYIQVHHKDPLATAVDGRAVNPVRDMVPLCANCHVMVHRHQPILTISALKKILKRRA